MALPFGKENMTLYCETYSAMRSGEGDHRRTHFSVVLLLPITLVTLFTIFFHFLLKPFGHNSFVSQMLAGIALGPSCLGRMDRRFTQKIFTARARMVFNVMEAVGFIFMLFTVAARIDKEIVFKKSGKQAIVIGVGSFIFPLLVALLMALLVKDTFQLDQQLHDSLTSIAATQSTIAFPVILNLLTDLKLLNSELGRLAISSSLISTLLSWLLPSFLSLVVEGSKSIHKRSTLLMLLCILLMIVVFVFVLRPIIFWIMRQIPEGKSLLPGHVLAINMMVLGSALFGEITGQQGFLAPLILGLSFPVRPPMGPLLVDRIQYFVWAVFIPCFVVNTGRSINLLSIGLDSFLAVEFIILVFFLAKVLAIIIPSLYFKIPFIDALSLCLILNCRGIYDVQLFTRAKQRQVISEESFGIITTTAMLQSAILIPLVRVLCDPSRRYVSYRKHTIQHCEQHAEFRILACINELDYVPTIINILQVSNPPESPVAVYVMKLVEYIGFSLPAIIPHKIERPVSSKNKKIDPMINALHNYQQQNLGFTSVQCFSAIAPYTSMHDDICSMAFQKDVSLMIIPFQKIDGPLIKSMLNNVLKMAPCSVAILFERGIFMEFKPIFSRRSSINVCVLFVEGPDDREALAYGSRMAKNDSIKLTVIRFIPMNQCAPISALIEEDQDLEMIDDFKARVIEKKNVEYVEQRVIDGSETARVVHAIGDNFELILVGKRHDRESQVLLGLVEWSEIEELGVVGDLLASSDFKSKASVMVIQQQAST